ncbi:DUF899 family protein [Bacillus luteolus]|uniref:DUF899 family protein n=1 Tax=Litchfieldia luteola TaxID=682179 RepID=A0ABR9QGC5_9BACI|nr:DUF899 family protein [Cytobacillus luteolus]MBE4907536.1 DUF899 family protein [Cytobacillus luteolus]MBP1944305.1 putative dithiol-disulfide oxidoreductase (DUF899 family)/putative enzyme related to lactoylglutathione lyase [Cytobacillus luteolus]
MTTIQEQINALEQEIFQKKKQLLDLRKSVEERLVSNYEFVTSSKQQTTLLDLFGDKNELFVIHNMGRGCSYCTMWADGFNGVYHHLVAKAGFVLASPDEPSVQEDFAAERKWQFPMVSVKDNSFTEDVGFIIENQHYPGVSTFRKDEYNNIYLHTQAFFGPGDDYCVPWHLFDLLPSGSENVQTKRNLNSQSAFQLTNNIAIGVKDYENALAFYKEVIGMKGEQIFENETKLTMSGTSFFIENNPANNVHFEFAVEDIEAAKNLLLDKGCQITKEYSAKSVMIEDPFGLKFHLFEPKK